MRDVYLSVCLPASIAAGSDSLNQASVAKLFTELVTYQSSLRKEDPGRQIEREGKGYKLDKCMNTVIPERERERKSQDL